MPHASDPSLPSHRANRTLVASAIAASVLALCMGGCPGFPQSEIIAGETGGSFLIAANADVEVFSPVTNQALTGGTPVDVNWRAVATTQFAVVNVFFDPDQNPDNGNEIFVERNLPLTTNNALLDTTDLNAGSYFIGVAVIEVGEIAAAEYASGQIIVNQRPKLSFTSPRDNFAFDRSSLVTPRFDVSWTVSDPDSALTTQIFLDPDDTPNGNEVLLRVSNSQTGDSFSFDLPVAGFEPGVYRILALVSDGVDQFAFYAPATIRIRARLAGFVDLRNLGSPQEGALEGAVFEGFNPRDNAGSFVRSIGDIDGDGFGDFMVLAQFGKPVFQVNAQSTGVGEGYLIYGRADRFSGSISLNSTGTLFRGEVYTGVPEAVQPLRPSRGITSMTVLSDWDGDGVRELAFGLPFTDSLPAGFLEGAGLPAVGAPLDAPGYFRSGAVVIQAGSALRPDLGFPGRQVINLADIGTLDHVNCTCSLGTCPTAACDCPEGFAGPKALSGAGFAVTGFHEHWFGDEGGPFEGGLRLGCRISSNDTFDQFGETVSAHEFDSIIMSAPNRDPIVSTARLSTQQLSIPGAGVVSIYFCNVIGGFYPWRATNAPPANADLGYPGTADPIAPALLPHHGPYHYIVDEFRTFPAFGGMFPGSPGFAVDPDDGEPCGLNFNDNAPNPTQTTRLWGGFPGARLGNSIGIEDFNSDGLRDMLVGSPLSNEGAGSTFIVFGRLRNLVKSGEMPIEDLSLPLTAPDPTQVRLFDGIRVVGQPGDRLGQSQDSAGDFNGDGIQDVVIGSPLVNNRKGGAAVFFGNREIINFTEDEIPFAEIADRGLGVNFEGVADGDLTGARVVSAGDLDGDGLGDILIAAPNRSVSLDLDLDGVLDVNRQNCGVVYLIYGSPTLQGTKNLSQIGTEELPGVVFIGRNSGDFLGAGLGLQGDRSTGVSAAGDVDGDGATDLLLSSVSASPKGRIGAGEVYLIYGISETE